MTYKQGLAYTTNHPCSNLSTNRCIMLSGSKLKLVFFKALRYPMDTYPWLCRVKVNALYSLRASKELSLNLRLSVSNQPPIASDISSTVSSSYRTFNSQFLSQKSYLDIQSHVGWGKGESRLCAASEMIDQGGEPGHEPFRQPSPGFQ